MIHLYPCVERINPTAHSVVDWTDPGAGPAGRCSTHGHARSVRNLHRLLQTPEYRSRPLTGSVPPLIKHMSRAAARASTCVRPVVQPARYARTVVRTGPRAPILIRS